MIHLPDPGPVAYCGAIVNTGSRDEEEKEQGMAHFIEHVIFKGTTKRKSYHILSRLDDVGGDLNAYTTKEETGLHAAFLCEYYERAMELVSDLIFNSTFPEKEIEKEKEVIYDEINSYLDSPSESIFDDFEDLIYDKHSLGRNILGKKELVKSFDQSMIKRFIRRNYHTDQIVFCSLGNIDFKKLIRLFEKYFGGVRKYERKRERNKFNSYEPKSLIVEKDTYLAHSISGNIAYDMFHPKKLGMTMLSNILGGPGMNSRLNLSLREKNGIAYNIDSNFVAYTDTGAFSIYLGTDSENLERSHRLVEKELNLLKNKKMGTMQLHKAKRQFIGQIAIGTDNKESLLLSLGKSFLYYDKVDSLEKLNKKIEALEATQLIEIANEVFQANQMSSLIFK